MHNNLDTNLLKIENWLKNKSNYIFYILLFFYMLFSLLYFNIKPSIAGDDSSYIIRAIHFLESDKFPTYQGPLYPLFLSLIIWITGMNLVILKLTSTVFMIGFIILFYKNFKNKISYISLFYTIGILSTSNYFLYFSSQTYSEAFFIFLQSIFFYLVFKGITHKSSSWKPNTKEVCLIVLTALLCVVLFLTRTVGFGAILAITVFYILQKQYARTFYITVVFTAMLVSFFTIRASAWDIPARSGEQSLQLLQKDPYNKSKGKEDLKGFLIRFKDNSNLYLSKHLMHITGLTSSSDRKTRPVLTLILYIIFALGIVVFARKSKPLFFTAIYLAIMLGITFFSLQKKWDQYRLIIFVPMALLMLSESLILPKKGRKWQFVNNLFITVLVISLALSTNHSFKTVDTTTLQKNLKGDKLYGYTPDWINYLKMAEYCHNELDPQSFVACRKPNMACIYGKGKKFHGIYRIPSKEADELVQYLKKRNISHVMMASLRKNPKMYTGQSINTIQRFLSVILKKYPNSIKVVKRFGTQEPTYLFKINYAAMQAENNTTNNEHIQ